MTMKVLASLDTARLAAYAAAQLNAMFPDGEAVGTNMLRPAVDGALPRLEHCFAQVNNKYFFDGGQAVFNHLHGDQYAMWLYFLSNELYRQGGPVSICSKLFLLNKALHGCDIFYEVALPSVFLLVHPLGTVLGRGTFSDYLLVYQRCGIGSNHDIYPTLGAHVTLRPGSAILGRCQVSDNCTIAAESLLLDKDLPANSTYIGNPRDHIIRPRPDKESIWRS